MTDKRLVQLSDWLEYALEDKNLEITVASADASFRRYFRVKTADKSWIAMDAPPEKEDCKPFVKVATAFHHLGVSVPEIYAQDLTHGFLVITDFGSRCYLDELNDENADQLYADAMQVLLNLQTNEKPQNVTLPEYDLALLNREMFLFDEWFLGEHLQLSLTDSDKKMLTQTQAQMAELALAQPKVWVHRDYHSRNLMFTEHNNPGVIDFQDAVNGPVTYDLVSLLRDCYIDWPLERVESWVAAYLQQLQQKQFCEDLSFETFMHWFDWMGVQRHMKAIGIFARLNYRDGKSGYLNDIPRTLNYVHTVSAKYPNLNSFNEFIEQKIMPALAAKS